MTMENHLHFNQILLALILPVIVIQATVVQNKFKKLEPGQNITGTIEAELNTTSKILCSDRCLNDESCQGYQYRDQVAGLGKCILIHNGCEENFQSTGSAVTYKKVSSKQSKVKWIPPSNWTGPSSVLYHSFDCSEGLVLMEGTEATPNSVPLVSGKANNAWSFNHKKSQWVDLGMHRDVCMTRPETCGAAGGAVSVWLRVIDCPNYHGLLSTQSQTTGSSIHSYRGDIRFYVQLPIGYFYAFYPELTGWSHIVGNYIGPNNGEGITLYLDGVQFASDTVKYAGSYTAGDGRIVVGRSFTKRGDQYAGIEVDELIFFNAALTDTDVQLIYNSA